MVSAIEIINVVGRCLQRNGAVNIVVDPVMVSKRLSSIKKEAGMSWLRCYPLAELVTPNLYEAEIITGDKKKHWPK